MKLIGIVLIIGVIFSYVPIIPMDDCPENSHPGDAKIDCGYCIHSPMLLNVDVSNQTPLLLIGRWIPMPYPSISDGVAPSIFHPPKL